MGKAVEGLGSHPIPEFSFLGDASVLGVLHSAFVHDSGSRVVMPASSLQSVGERPKVIAVIGEVASVAAEHGGYHRTDKIAELPERTVLKAAEVDEARGIFRRASIYEVPGHGVIIKAFDKAPNREAVAQYAVMAALHAQLSAARPLARLPLRGPEQYALVQPPTGKHRTIVMEAVPGRRLYDVLGDLLDERAHDVSARQALSGLIKPVLEAGVAGQVDPTLLPYVNDITGGADGGLYTNLIVTPTRQDALPETADDVTAMITDAAIIDQPRFLPEFRARGWRDGMDRIAKLLNR